MVYFLAFFPCLHDDKFKSWFLKFVESEVRILNMEGWKKLVGILLPPMVMLF